MLQGSNYLLTVNGILGADLNAEQLSAQSGLLVADSAYTFETQHGSDIRIVGQKAAAVKTQVGGG